MKNFKAVEKFCCSQYCGISYRLNLQYCGSDFYWSRGRLFGKCSNQCCLPVFYHLPCHCTTGRNWQCFPCFPLSWTQRAESCRQSSGKWYCSDGNFRNYLFAGWRTFLSLLLKAFGATTDVFPYAKQYASITLIGMPFLIVTNGMSNLIRADGKPKYSMVCMVVGAIINTILDPIFIFVCDWGIAGAAWATVIGQIFPSYSHSVIYGVSKQSILKKSRFYWTSKKA